MSTLAASMHLRPYQQEIADAILDSVWHRKGLTFSVEIARQGGKNELSARLEMLLLILNSGSPLQIIKCSPTFKPQTVISMTRLKDRLNESNFSGAWSSEMGYIIRLAEARAVFLSADVSSNVVGNTAHLLLEVDESQDVDPDKYTKEFKPMGATTNCTVVHYGTTWNDSTLLESIKQTNLELEKKDGIKRHFRFDYQEVGKYNHAYLLNVEMERQRIGESHPLFLTQYRLLPLHGGGRFLSSMQRAQLQGDHSRLHHPSSQNSELITHNSKIYVASIDLAGEAETGDDDFYKVLHPQRDSTVITIAELDFTGLNLDPILLRPRHPELDPGSRIATGRWSAFARQPKQSFAVCRLGGSPHLYLPSQPCHPGLDQGSSPFPSSIPTQNPVPGYPLGASLDRGSSLLSGLSAENLVPGASLDRGCKLPALKIVEHYSWTGVRHSELYPQMIDLLKNVWHCRRIVVDATGIGQPVASFLRQHLGSRVVPFTFTSPAKSQLGFNLLAAINSGRLKMYAADNSPEYKEFWLQMERAKSFYRPSQTLNFFVDPSDGHDDFLMSLALLVESAGLYKPRIAVGRGSFNHLA